jgi:hypothetical protein
MDGPAALLPVQLCYEFLMADDVNMGQCQWRTEGGGRGGGRPGRRREGGRQNGHQSTGARERFFQ